ncbi:hypothetical protein F5Y16DRAFT_392364 [Xylariaceae sp. FL0255]|nr:hypothetical protein F5Y16DRAFT_392364 [Xylariaceae sp. FL0255]
MCFFDQICWSCGNWRWGSFREKCIREHRTGETCGLKFVYNTTRKVDVCKLCKGIAKKQRKYNKFESDVSRWLTETNRTATIEKAQKDMFDINRAINRMRENHHT